jgi:hypothetical protein
MSASAAAHLEFDTDVRPVGAAPPAATLYVDRTDITFHSPGPGRVAVAVAVTNLGGERSLPTAAIVQAAPLGAFVPWRPIAVVPVPALMPGRSATLRIDGVRPQARPLGPPDRVPPRRLLTALGAGDAPARGRGQSWTDTLRNLLARPGDRPAPPGSPAWPAGALPADPMELLGRGALHWAGNLNIFLAGRAVERHMAQALRVYPGMVNMAIFFVGAEGTDEYSFRLEGSGVGWGAALYDLTDRGSLAIDLGHERPLEEDRWVPVCHTRILALALRPPEDCPAGSVEVQVRQRSTGSRAVVEFSLDPRAAGPGCYTL